MSRQSLKEMLDSLNQLTDSHGKPATPHERQATVAQLLEITALFNTKHVFAVGDIVETKPGTEHKKGAPGNVHIVMNVLAEPLVLTSDDGDRANTPYFREPLDIIIAQLGEDGCLLEFHVDSRRYQPYSGPMPATN